MVCMAIFRARKFQNLSKAMASQATFLHYLSGYRKPLIDQGASYFHDRLASGRPSQAETLMAVFAP